jgi:hypothetical protein
MKDSDLFAKYIIIKTIITMTQELITMVQGKLISICFHVDNSTHDRQACIIQHHQLNFFGGCQSDEL